MSLKAEDLLTSPDYFPLRFDGPNLVVVRMSRDSYAQSIFTLPNRIVTDGNEAWSVPFAEIVALFEDAKLEQSSASWIFQIAHCGSTLLSRALDKPGHSLVIRESFALRQFAASPSATDPAAIELRKRGLQVLIQLLNRQYQASEPVIIKANVPVNFCIPEILDLSPGSKAIFLYSTLDDYLLAILKAEERQHWVLHVIKELAAKISSVSGFEDIKLASLNFSQAAAVLWVSQLQCYRASADSRQSLRALLSDNLYATPDKVIHSSANHFGIDLNDEEVRLIASSDLFTRHAKIPDQEYSEQHRLAELDMLRSQFASELNDVRQWCRQQGFMLDPEMYQTLTLSGNQ